MRKSAFLIYVLLFVFVFSIGIFAACHTSPLVITEMLVHPEGTQCYEYAEITNVSDAEVDLYDYKIIKTPMSIGNENGYSHCYPANAKGECVLAPGESALIIFISAGNHEYTPLSQTEKTSVLSYENGKIVYNMALYDEIFERYTGVSDISSHVKLIFCPLVEWNGEAFVNGKYGVSLANSVAQTVGIAPRSATSTSQILSQATNSVGKDGKAVLGKATHFAMPKAIDSVSMAVAQAYGTPTPGTVDIDIRTKSLFLAPHGLVISEILANPEGTQAYEYAEITNLSEDSIDLYDYKIMRTPMSIGNDLGYSHCYMADAPGQYVLAPKESALLIFLSGNNHYYSPLDGRGKTSVIAYENGEYIYDLELYNEMFERYTGVRSITESTKLIFCPLVEWNGESFVNGTYGVALGNTGAFTLYIAPRNASSTNEAVCRATNAVGDDNIAIEGKATRFVPSPYPGDIMMRIEEKAAQPTPGTADMHTPYVFSNSAQVFAETAQIARPVLYQLKPSTSTQHMSYIIKTANGKLMVYDGGVQGDGEYLLSALQTISGQTKPHITAWFISHMHDDHMGALVSICNAVTVDAVHYATPTYDLLQTVGINASFDQFVKAAQTAVGDIGTLHFLQEGERFVIDGVEIEVLFVPDVKRVIAMGNDSRRNPGSNNWANDTSIITRFTIGGKTVMFMGDCGQNEGVLLVEKYGSQLKSDFCQMAHHGQDAVDKPVYEAIRPDVCLYPAPLWLWDNVNGNLTIMETRGWMNEIGYYTDIIAGNGDTAVIFEECGNKEDTPEPKKISSVGPLAFTELCRTPGSVEYAEVQNVSDNAVDLYDYKIWYTMGNATSDGTDLLPHQAQRFYRISSTPDTMILMPGETVILWFITAGNAAEYAEIDYTAKTVTPIEAKYRDRVEEVLGVALPEEQKVIGYSLCHVDGQTLVNDTTSKFNLGDGGTIHMWITESHMANAYMHMASAILPYGVNSCEYLLPQSGTDMMKASENKATPGTAPILDKNGFFMSEEYGLFSLYCDNAHENVNMIFASFDQDGRLLCVSVESVDVKAGFFGCLKAFHEIATQGESFAAYLWQKDLQPICLYRVPAL